MMMRAFFPYYGSKYRLAKKLGPPRCDIVIEPFAGSACYSTYWQPAHVWLVERDPIMYRVWHYLIHASEREIVNLPNRVLDIDDPRLLRVCDEARWLIGLWFDHRVQRPRRTMGNWGRNSTRWRNYWCEDIKWRIIRQLPLIRHWQVIEGNHWDAPDIEAHFHVDAPYQALCGRHYHCNHIDYVALAQWCLSRKGFIQVCEGAGASWLPFEFFAVMPGHQKLSEEWLYQKDNRSVAKRAPA